MKFITAAIFTSVLLLLSISSVSAAYVEGDSIGVFDAHISDGAAAEATLASLLGIDSSLVTFLGKIDLPSLSDDLFSITTDQDPNEAISGTWTYSGMESANYITLKAGQEQNGGGLEILFFEDPNMGIWDTSNLFNKGLSNIAAFQVVPIPATLPLFISGIGALLMFKRRHSQLINHI